MRQPIKATVEMLEPPGSDEREKASSLWGRAEAHARFQAEWTCLNAIELAKPATVSPLAAELTVTAWNIERCKHIEASAELLQRVSADIVLATEMDHGMARSNQRHTTRELAVGLGFSYAFGVEFVELGLGDVHETTVCAGMTNRHGLHGNAILSRWPLEDVALIPLDDGGAWFVAAPKNDGQYRVGGRMAIAARIMTANGPLVLASVHYESESDALGRAQQTRNLLVALDRLYGRVPAVVGGDLNTKGFLEAGMSAPETLATPEAAEPSFEHVTAHGFDWRTANLGKITTRLPPHSPQDRPLKTLDWLFTRGVVASQPFITPALSVAGDYLSDHELIGARIEI